MKRIIKVLLSSIFCLSTLVGCSRSPYANAEAQTLTVKGIPVYVEPDEKMTQDEVNLHLKAIESQPEFLMKNCTEIHLQGKSNYSERLRQEYSTNYNKTAGYAEEEKIFLNTNLNENSLKRDRTSIKDTVAHELWHVFDYVNGNDEYYLSELDFNVLYNQNPNSLGDYGARNTLEFFAEGGMMYINSPEELKEKNMGVYNYFESLPKE